MATLQKVIFAGLVLLLGSALVMGAGNLLEEDTCYTTKGDPKTTYCLVEERPIDLQLQNRHEDPHNISVLVSDSAGVVYSETANLSSDEERTLEDVIRAPGEYEVQATLDNDGTDSMTLTVEKRHCLKCPKLVRVTSDGDLIVATPPSG